MSVATVLNFGGVSSHYFPSNLNIRMNGSGTGVSSFVTAATTTLTAAPIVAQQTLSERYRITKKVGDGTFGEVSLAKKLDTGDLVAIKR